MCWLQVDQPFLRPAARLAPAEDRRPAGEEELDPQGGARRPGELPERRAGGVERERLLLLRRLLGGLSAHRGATHGARAVRRETTPVGREAPNAGSCHALASFALTGEHALSEPATALTEEEEEEEEEVKRSLDCGLGRDLRGDGDRRGV
ncbi:hypothetical protein FQA47_017068 [Oryzias melastigma]|uniref:Uncharacterized protein n=1 Tax=Oryzias melastigma TaxID=30732 RepID=A0A834L195_ORYME|nr:hypothetical protein FQA47_017068 [Oryzias melastigma]